MFNLKKIVFVPILLFAIFQISSVNCQTKERTNFKTIFDLLLNVGRDYYFESNGVSSGLKYPSRYECPVCDSSVYSYCSDKLLHDACCCLNPYDHQLPYQCRYADCSFLHANSCREHKLITACCCSHLIK